MADLSRLELASLAKQLVTESVTRRGLALLAVQEHPFVDSDLALLSQAFRHRDVNGLGVGPKIVGGIAIPERIVLRVYVVKKSPLDSVAAPILPFVRLKGGGFLETDVVELGEIEPQSANMRQRCRPVTPGVSIGHKTVTAGTLGCVVKKVGDSNESRFLLSSFHILGADGAASVGDPILQPGSLDGGASSQDLVAHFCEGVPFDFEGESCFVDAGLAQIESGIEFANDFVANGSPVEVKWEPELTVVGEKVQKIGRTTGLSEGVVTDASGATLKISHAKPGGTKRFPVVFADQVICTKYAEGGDSGSLVFNSKGNVVGLHMAGNDKISVFNRIQHVIELLQIEMA